MSKPEKVTSLDKLVTDKILISHLKRANIDQDYVEFVRDYGKDNPYSKHYLDRISGRRFAVFSQLPMCDHQGKKVDVGWIEDEGKYIEKNNLFQALVQDRLVEIAIRNDQPDGRKAGDFVQFHPQLFLDNEEIDCLPLKLLETDPINENYSNNVLEWDYGICKRRLRLIEGCLLGSWVFSSNPHGTIKIKYNQSGDFRLKLGQFKVNEDEEIVPTTAFEKPVFGYPFTVSDSATFYPDAHPESTSVDGRLQCASDPADWATLHDATDANGGDDTTDYLNTYILSSATSNKWTSIYRSILLFDTSSLPDAATISAVTASLYGYSTYGANFGSTLNWYSSSPASNVALVYADFDQVGTTAFATAIAASSFNVGTPGTSTDWTFNAAGIAAISKTGVTKLSFRENHDATNTAPTWESSKSGGCIPWSSDKGTGYKPKLVVEYSTKINVSLTDSFSAGDSRSETAAMSASLTDSLTGSDTSPETIAAALALTDGFKASDSTTRALIYYVILSDSLKGGDATTISAEAFPVITDILKGADAMTLLGSFTASVSDAMKGGDTPSPLSTMYRSLTDTMKGGDTLSLLASMSKVITDGVLGGDVPLILATMYQSLADEMKAGDTNSTLATMYVQLEDALKNGDAILVNKVIFVSLSDGLSLSDLAEFLGRVLMLKIVLSKYRDVKALTTKYRDINTKTS